MAAMIGEGGRRRWIVDEVGWVEVVWGDVRLTIGVWGWEKVVVWIMEVVGLAKLRWNIWDAIDEASMVKVVKSIDC